MFDKQYVFEMKKVFVLICIRFYVVIALTNKEKYIFLLVIQIFEKGAKYEYSWLYTREVGQHALLHRKLCTN